MTPFSMPDRSRPTRPPEVLFVCVHNAGRSQMAAVLTDSMSGGRVHVRSAGSTPASEINPVVVEAMRELGLDLSQEFPKPLTDEAVEAADVVITMGCGDACPIYPGKRYLDWEVDDPAGQPLAGPPHPRRHPHACCRPLARARGQYLLRASLGFPYRAYSVLS